MMEIEVLLVNMMRINICGVKHKWIPQSNQINFLGDLIKEIEYEDFKGVPTGILVNVNNFREYLIFIHKKVMLKKQ